MWNGWGFLTSTVPMGPLGLLIYWLTVLVVDMEGPPPTRTGEGNLGGILGFFPSRGIVPFVSFRFTIVGSWKTCAPLCAASMTTSFKAIVWRACKVPLLVATPYANGGSIGGMIPGMVRLINNYCGGFPLVVSVSMTFPFFPSLV